MSTKMLSVLAAVVAIIAVLLFLAWSAQRTLERGLPPKDTSAANRAEGFLFASDFAQKTGGEIFGVLGTGSMAPYIPAGKAEDVVAYAVTRKGATLRDVVPGDVCFYKRDDAAYKGLVIHGAAEFTSAGWIMSGLGNRSHDIRMNADNFVGIVAKVFVWKG